MDVVTLAAAKAAAKPNVRPYNALAKMSRGADACIDLMGDSTANGTDEWFYLMLQGLATEFPNQRILHYLWDDPSNLPGPPTLGTGSYDAPTVVSAGVVPAAVTDAFNRADGALGSTDSGQAWQSVANLTVSSNKALSGGSSLALVEVGRPSYTITMDTAVPSSTGEVRLYLRYLDGNNNLVVSLFNNGAGSTQLIINQRINSTVTSVASVVLAGLTAGTAATLTVVASRTSIVATVTGFAALTYNLVRRDHETYGEATRVGIGATISGPTIDNLVITPTAPTLYAYNASTPGQFSSYSLARIRTQLQGFPDLVMINYGYNESGTDVSAAYLPLARTALAMFPWTELVAVGQGARGPADSTYLASLFKNNSIMALAARHGWGYVNATQKFLDNPTYVADWLQSDSIHPNPAGSIVWAQEVRAHLQNKPRAVPPSARGWGDNVRMFPSSFVLSEGAPARAVYNARQDAWAFDPSTQGGIIGSVGIPSGWASFNVTALFTVPLTSGLTGSTNQIRLDVGYTVLADMTEVTQKNAVTDTTGVVPTALDVTAAFAVTAVSAFLNNLSANSQYASRVLSNVPVTGRPVSIQVRRLAADALDTYTGIMYLVALILERAT